METKGVNKNAIWAAIVLGAIFSVVALGIAIWPKSNGGEKTAIIPTPPTTNEVVTYVVDVEVGSVIPNINLSPNHPIRLRVFPGKDDAVLRCRTPDYPGYWHRLVRDDGGRDKGSDVGPFQIVVKPPAIPSGGESVVIYLLKGNGSATISLLPQVSTEKVPDREERQRRDPFQQPPEATPLSPAPNRTLQVLT
ncbi:MAG: hypothetical protein UV58_C0002G0060 [Candidatus Wolfebacteria bacterium GW2011_GWC1_43_10]|uniref:Uncharacterized protein n=1 Tax=Candidatus Wolfebacteria bacterium GW2011_GWC1_43_10 TaxID=1619011 RepID=A0A0G1CBL1_9BACT|nr:MAG: hypothetical protein UV58_C0002G0060 [Candidatus Wolfebacteria bacterium GW2011_GWC1_43_10]